MAGAALLPDFPPVEIDGRLLVDGGLVANLPAHLILDPALTEASTERLTLFALDLFASAAPLPRGLGEASQRLGDLIFAGQSRRTLETWSRIWAGHTPGADVVCIAYQALAAETPLKGFDFSRGSLDRRWQAGKADMWARIETWRATPGTAPGLTIV
jgi:NTE family protein